MLTRPLSRYYADPALRRPGLLLGFACVRAGHRAQVRGAAGQPGGSGAQAGARPAPEPPRAHRRPCLRTRQRAAANAAALHALVLEVGVEDGVRLRALRGEPGKRSASSASSASEYSYWKRPDEACVVRFQAAALRPCSRNSVSSGCVLAQTAGTLFSGPAGASTTVCTAPRSRSRASVPAVAAGLSNQLRWRSSMEIRCSSMRRAASASAAWPRASRPGRELEMHGA